MTEFSIKDMGFLPSRLWRNKWIILLVTLSGLLAGMAVTADNKAEVNYSAISSVCVTYTTYQDQMRGSSVIASYSDLAASYLVCQRAAELLDDTELTPADIQNMTDNWVGSNSYVMYISTTTAESQLAIQVANAVAQAFTEKVSGISGNNSVQILDLAQKATMHTDSKSTTILIAAALPFAIVCAWIALRDVLRGKVSRLSRCVEDPEELLGILPDTTCKWR